MDYDNYNQLLQSSSLENFQESLECSSGGTFNSLINILAEENVSFKVKQGFDYTSKDKQISNFKKISFEFNKPEEIDKIIKDYELDGIFSINRKKNEFTFVIK